MITNDYMKTNPVMTTKQEVAFLLFLIAALVLLCACALIIAY